MENLQITEVPENQMTIFDALEDFEKNLFKEEDAKWGQKDRWIKYLPNEWICGVIGIVPSYLYSPMEKGVRAGYPTEDLDKQRQIWSNYVYSISLLIPYHERGEEDINGWSAACEKLAKARDERKPIELSIWRSDAAYYKDLEVIEYLPESRD